MASTILVDANILLDILTADPRWLGWSSSALRSARASSPLAVNPIVCAEVAPAFDCDWPRLDAWLAKAQFVKEPLPFAASSVVAAAHREYRRRGGVRTTPLPDFYIGAHAEVEGHMLLTRDASRYRTYFPRVPLIAPRE